MFCGCALNTLVNPHELAKFLSLAISACVIKIVINNYQKQTTFYKTCSTIQYRQCLCGMLNCRSINHSIFRTFVYEKTIIEVGKKHVIKYCKKVYERSGKILFWSIKNSGENLDKLKARDFNATSLSTYYFLLFTRLYFIIQLKISLLVLWK